MLIARWTPLFFGGGGGRKKKEKGMEEKSVAAVVVCYLSFQLGVLVTVSGPWKKGGGGKKKKRKGQEGRGKRDPAALHSFLWCHH